MRTDAAVCPRGGGRPRGSAPGNPGRGAASTLRKARAALAGASRPLTRRRVFSGGLPPKKTLGGIVKDGGYSRWRKGRSFSTLHRNGLPSRSLPTSRKSWEGGRWGSGGGGRKALLQKVFPPSFPGMSRLPTLHPATALPRKESKTRSPRSPRNGWAALRQPQAADRTTPCPFPRCPRHQQRPRR